MTYSYLKNYKMKVTDKALDNKKIQITLKRKADKLTEIAIRVCTFGDETPSRLILEKIRSHY
jgi:uncharacterized protein DUF3568